MLQEKLAEMINKQINRELYSAYLYLSMADYYSDVNLDGFENWFYIQTQEERDHAMLLRTYLLNNDCPVKLEAIDAPGVSFADYKAPLTAALEHEQKVTAWINEIYAVAYELKDFQTMQFLDWFVKEQGEEETNANDLIDKMELFGSDPKSLYMLNSELAARVYNAPSLVL